MSGLKTALPLLLIAAPLLAAGLPTPSKAAGLEALKWKARPVLVFAPRHGDPRMIAQLDALKPVAGDLADRDMPVFIVTGSDAAPVVSVGADILPKGSDLRKTYGVADDAFAVVLVGKDGGQKLKSDKPVDGKTLTSTVDAMPMRQGETR